MFQCSLRECSLVHSCRQGRRRRCVCAGCRESYCQAAGGERNPQNLEVCWDAAATREGLADGGGEHGAVGEILDQKLPLAAGLLVPSVLGVSALWRQI